MSQLKNSNCDIMNEAFAEPLPLGTGLKIPPAAQQALQMTGSMAFGNIPGAGEIVHFAKDDGVFI